MWNTFSKVKTAGVSGTTVYNQVSNWMSWRRHSTNRHSSNELGEHESGVLNLHVWRWTTGGLSGASWVFEVKLAVALVFCTFFKFHTLSDPMPHYALAIQATRDARKAVSTYGSGFPWNILCART